MHAGDEMQDERPDSSEFDGNVNLEKFSVKTRHSVLFNFNIYPMLSIQFNI